MNTNVLTHYLVSVPAIFIVITIHEFTKAAVSSALGDVAPKIADFINAPVPRAFPHKRSLRQHRSV